MKNLLEEWKLLSWSQKLAALIGVVLVILVFLALLTSCGGKATEPFKDAPVGTHDESPADVVEMPDGFSNVATKCDTFGNRVYSLFHSDGDYGSVYVVPQDPSCALGGSGG